FVLLLIQLASAEIHVNKYTNEFALSSSYIDTKTCGCSEVLIPITVDNVGDVDGVFHVTVDSKKSWFSVEKDSFHLESGQAMATNVKVQVPCDAKGKTDYTIKVSSTYGREKYLHRSLEVVVCQNLIVEPVVKTQIKGPGELATFRFDVKNAGTFEDTFKIKAKDYNEYLTTSSSSFILDAGDSQEVFVYAKMPVQNYGEYTIPVTVTAERSGLSKDIDLYLKILRNYQFSTDLQSKVFACTKVSKDLEVTISNNANVSNSYDLSLDAPEFVELEKGLVALEPGQNETVIIKITPDENTGVFDAALKVVSERGNIEQVKNLELEVAKCYEHELLIQEGAKMICGVGILQAQLKNNGVFEEVFDIEIDNGDWAVASPSTVTLEPGEFTSIDLELEPPCADSEHEVTLIAVNKGLPSITSSATVTLQVITPSTAYLLGLPEHNFLIKYDYEELLVPVANKGIKQGTYTIDVDSEFLVPAQNEVTIPAGEERQVKLIITDLEGLDEGEYLHGLVLTLENSTVVYKTNIGTMLKGPTWFENLSNWMYSTLYLSKWYSRMGLCGWSGVLLYLILIVLIVIYILILAKAILVRRFTVDYRNEFGFIRVVLTIVILLALMYSLSGMSTTKQEFYEEPLDGGALFHQWKQDEVYSFAIADYYRDPDFDMLTFSSIGNTNIAIEFEGEEAVLTPTQGWHGEEEVVFTATDETGAWAESPAMTLKVLRKKNLSWFGYWLGNCTQVNVLIIALIFLAMMLLVDTVAPRGREYYFGKAEKKRIRRRKSKKGPKKYRRY
ncbi:hypothetical protein ACFL1B_03895, partial [Nanoarchaeota archaeon]